MKSSCMLSGLCFLLPLVSCLFTFGSCSDLPKGEVRVCQCRGRSATYHYVIRIGGVNKACFIVEYVGNYLYLAAKFNAQNELHQESVMFYRYHVINNTWEKLPELKSKQKIDCLCSVGGFVYAISNTSHPRCTVWLITSGSRAGII